MSKKKRFLSSEHKLITIRNYVTSKIALIEGDIFYQHGAPPPREEDDLVDVWSASIRNEIRRREFDGSLLELRRVLSMIDEDGLETHHD